jgi:hypothetical protein
VWLIGVHARWLVPGSSEKRHSSGVLSVARDMEAGRIESPVYTQNLGLSVDMSSNDGKE